MKPFFCLLLIKNGVCRELRIVLAFLFFSCTIVRAQGDNCYQALGISSINNFCSTYAQFSNAGSTPSTIPLPSCWSSNATEDIWFSFLSTQSDILLAINGALMMQPRIALYSGPCNALVEVPGSCTNGTTGTSDAQIFCSGLVQGEYYFIRISTTQANEGSFQLCVNNFSPPGTASADCSGAGNLCSKDPISVAGLSGGGDHPNEGGGTCLAANGVSESNSVWYTWTCANSGTLTFDISPANQTDDIDFALFKLNTPDPCGSRSVIRCSATSCLNVANNSTGLNMGSADISENPGCAPGEDRYVKYIDMIAGTSYALLINNASASNGFTISWGGSGTFAGPYANITVSSSEVCLGTPIVFDGSTSANYDFLNWSFNDGAGNPSTATGPGPISVNYSNPGMHTAILNAVDTSGCSVTHLINVTVWAIVNPVFTQIPPVCLGTTPPNLPTTSNNGITGTWSPSAINNTTSGTYTFTPNPGECATPTTMTVDVVAPVTPTFAQIPDFCEQTTAPVLLSSSTNSPPIAGTWSPSTVSNTSGGTYTFTPTAGSCATNTTMTIHLISRTNPVFDQPVAFCAGTAAPVLAGVSNDGISGSWSPSPVSNTMSGTYTFTPNSNECANPATLSITVNPSPVVTLSSNSPVCIGFPIHLSANTVSGGAYDWSGPSAFDSNLEDPVIAVATVNNAGTYSLIITDANGCVGTGTIAVVVNGPIAPVLTPAGPFCSENTTPINLTADIQGGTWTGTGITNPAGEFTASIAGIGNHTLTYTYTQGCGGTASMDVQVVPPPGSDFGANLTSGCPPLTVNFVSGTNADSALWDLGNGAILGGVVGGCSYTFTSSGTYTITLTNYFDGCVSTSSHSNYIYVYTAPNASFSVSETQLDQSNTLVEFYNASTNAVLSTWDFGDGSATSSETNPTHTFPIEAGSYLVELTVESDSGCIDKAYTTIVVKEYKLIYVPNSFTPNNDPYNNVFSPILAEGFDLENYTLQIFNRWGETVFESTDVNNGWDGSYKGKKVMDGTYTWTIRVKDRTDAAFNVYEGHVNLLK